MTVDHITTQIQMVQKGEDMFVKSSTALGKLSLVIFSLLLGACSSYNPNTSHSIVSGTGDQYHTVNSVLIAGHNWTHFKYYSLSARDKLKQQEAVYFALNNADVGQVTEWHNAQSGTYGAVKVVMSYPMGGGICRVIQSQIYHKKKTKDFTEKACLNYTEDKWHFIR